MLLGVTATEHFDSIKDKDHRETECYKKASYFKGKLSRKVKILLLGEIVIEEIVTRKKHFYVKSCRKSCITFFCEWITIFQKKH